ncbi:hypothetical protein QBC46DRAFT_321657 [Diplogelasinospora grovesii]|uniref:Uncharacterized protein n=1 Tax=Diplogelasinospora grovesii TaxID=303347 RepID=A0AAN6MZE6_9PEZI|nr:hypothetical protein QBC46DRAFT_321657 [Diplogelasinospora grovesii]
MHHFHSLRTQFRAVARVLAICFVLFSPSAAQKCITHDQPNPIASQYPDLPTGTLNSTTAIIPIPLASALAIIPSKWRILEGAYRSLLPNFPAGQYPVFLYAAHDHDIQIPAFNFTLPDFSRTSFNFPFLDLLGDGYTSFTWTPSQLISADSAALAGAQGYGQVAYAASFDPPCDAYRAVPGGCGTYHKSVSTNSTSGSGHVFVELDDFQPITHGSPYTLKFYKNITNQPIFGNGALCDNMIRLFNTTLTKGVFEPRFVKGKVSANLPPMNRMQVMEGVYGLQADTPFIENTQVECATLQGYSG